jgi:hypothetical protein
LSRLCQATRPFNFWYWFLWLWNFWERVISNNFMLEKCLFFLLPSYHSEIKFFLSCFLVN